MAGRLVFPTLSLLSLSLLTAAKPEDGFSVVSHIGNGGLSASQAGVGLGVDDSQDIEVCLTDFCHTRMIIIRMLVPRQHYLRRTT